MRNGRTPEVKILGKEGISKKLSIAAGIALSAGAKAAIEKAGGTIANQK
jgi:ribosomal protein L15